MSTETLRPNAAGAEESIAYVTGDDAGTHWKAVDEADADDDISYVNPSGDTYQRDLYKLPNHSVGSGIINFIKIYFRCKGEDLYAKPSLRSDTTVTDGTEITLSDPENYVTYSEQWNTNPAPPGTDAWAWADIDALQIGVSLRKVDKASPRCTQVYVEVDYTPIPDPPTNVQATNGAHTDKVVVTWIKSTGATKYEVFRDDVGLGELGDVATYDDNGAGAPTITPGAAAASDGLYVDKVALSLSGQSANNGTTHTYKVKAGNVAGWSGYSDSDTGYRGVDSLTYQWQRSAADSDAAYSNIDGATTASYDDTDAPADGSGRYYRCVENATGAAEQTSSSDRGYRAASAKRSYGFIIG